jgi:hypothetical protein
MSLRFTQTDFFLNKIHPVLAKFPLYDYWLLKRKSYLRNTGWFKSFRNGKSVDKNGNPVPWFTYGVIELLNDRLPSEFSLFEYGCGYGTQWWAFRATKADAVEHEKQWVDKISQSMPDHVRIIYRELGESYQSAIADSGLQYDVIVIDGRDRVKCCRHAVSSISDRGIIIFDDTNREKYIEGVEHLKSHGFKQLSFKGFSPIEFLECETSVFYREGNLLNL